MKKTNKSAQKIFYAICPGPLGELSVVEGPFFTQKEAEAYILEDCRCCWEQASSDLKDDPAKFFDDWMVVQHVRYIRPVAKVTTDIRLTTAKL